MDLNVAVVPGYYLVCYNHNPIYQWLFYAVVPGYYLVCYNNRLCIVIGDSAVVPGYYLVCYNFYIFHYISKPL